MSYYTVIVLAGAHYFGVLFPKLQTISRIFLLLPIDYSLYENMLLGIFVYLFIFEVTTTKVNFRFYKQCRKAVTHLFRKGPIFAQNASIGFEL